MLRPILSTPLTHCTERESWKLCKLKHPSLLPYFASAWDETGSVSWTSPTDDTNTRHAEEYHKASPLTAILFALTFGITGREGLHEHQTPNLTHADDFTVWGEKPGEQELEQPDIGSEQSPD